jgi:hypothetical protein
MMLVTYQKKEREEIHNELNSKALLNDPQSYMYEMSDEEFNRVINKFNEFKESK